MTVKKKNSSRPKYVYLDKFNKKIKNIEEDIESKLTLSNDIKIFRIISTISIILSIISIIGTFI